MKWLTALLLCTLFGFLLAGFDGAVVAFRGYLVGNMIAVVIFTVWIAAATAWDYLRLRLRLYRYRRQAHRRIGGPW